jgi:hypothetical protein
MAAMEATEINEFGKEMQEAGEKSMTHVSLIISVLAVLVAMVTVLGHREHTEATLTQNRSSDKWSEYQQRKMRSTQLLATNQLLALQPSANAAATAQQIEKNKAQMEKWNKEDEQAQEAAKDFDSEVQLVERKASRFDLGEALLQISVVLASITLLTRKSAYVAGGLLLGVAGLAIAASAFLVR